MQAFAFAAQHDPDLPRKIRFGIFFLGALVESNQPVARFLHFFHRANEIFHPRHGQMRQSSSRRAFNSVG